jgi:hypothetical protein
MLGLQLEDVDRLFAGESQEYTAATFTAKDGVRHMEEASS